MRKNAILAASPLLIGLIASASCMKRTSESQQLEKPPSLAAAVAQAPTVGFCDLISNSKVYEKKIVRTSALYFRNLENAYLYDPSCSSPTNYMWVELESSYGYSEEATKKKFESVYCSKLPCSLQKTRVTVVGRLEGPSNGPYGHLDSYRIKLSTIRVEKVADESR